MSTGKLKFTENTSKGAELKVFCSRCNGQRNHRVLVSIDEDGSEPIYNDTVLINWHDIYQIIKCQGCDNVSFRNYHTNSEEHFYYEDQGRETIYPQTKSFTHEIKEFSNIPRKLKSIYKETINCLNDNNHLLSAAGVRALIEFICKNKGIADYEEPIKAGGKKRIKNLEKKIDELATKGFLTEENANSLHELRFMGNTALHELSSPKEEDLILAIEILENTFITLYEIPEKSAKLKTQRLKK